MAGFQIDIMKRSLQARLSLALAAAILLVGLGAGGYSFVAAYRDSIRTQDDLLMQMGSFVQQLDVTLPREGIVGDYPGSNHETRVIVQRLDPPAQLADGFHTRYLHHEYFRVYVQSLANGQRIALSQETDVRERIARHSARRAVLPFLLLVPLLLLAVRRITRSLFAPVVSLSQEIDRRRDDQLQAIPSSSLPSETRPLVEAINRLLARVEAAMTAQRRFVADAAHELRTPLTALSLQAERLRDAELSGPASERLERLGSGIERAKLLVQQMLALARAQASQPMSLQVFPLQQVVRPVLEDLLPMAEQRQIDLGVDSPLEQPVRSDALALGQLLTNLIDNALRYTEPGGSVSLRLHAEGQRVCLEISDTGPGIAVAERERIFQPFYRGEGAAGPGSGLGLAIVQTLAQRLDIAVTLDTADEAGQRGLKVTLAIPAAPAPAAGPN